MKWRSTILALFVLLTAYSAAADAQWDGVELHPVIEMDGVHCETVWFDISGAATPTISGLGAVLVGLTDVTMTADRNRAPGQGLRMSCQGLVPFGEPVTARDLATGEIIEVVLATTVEFCLRFPGPHCMEQGKLGVRLQAAAPYGTCRVATPEGHTQISNYSATWTSVGHVKLNCHDLYYQNHCRADDACIPGHFCQFQTGDCGQEVGMCHFIPDGCGAVYDPVCGCDGESYSNSCVAATQGTSVAHDGPCDGSLCFGNTGLVTDCGAESYCAKPPGKCLASPQQFGQCEPRPEDCGSTLLPVCGCNGITYANACRAAADGTSVAAKGPCT